MMLNDAETGTSVAESRSVNRSLADVVLDMRQLRYRVPARQWPNPIEAIVLLFTHLLLPARLYWPGV
jgi:hypothetical protein